MNIVIVSDSGTASGGAAKVAIDSAVGLAAAGLNVYFISGSGKDPELAIPGIRSFVLNRPEVAGNARAALSGIWDTSAEGTVDDLLAELDPRKTVVHLHSFRDRLSVSVAAPAFQRKVPTVMTAHDYGLACPYGGFFDYKAGTRCLRKGGSWDCHLSGCNDGSPLAKAYFDFRHFIQSRWIPRHLRHLIVLSETSLNVLGPYLPAECRTYRVDNPVNVQKEPRRPQVPDQPIVFVGSLALHKDPLLVAQVAEDLAAPIRFVGDGPLAGVIRRKHPHAEVTGWLKPSQVRAALRDSAVLVFPSLWYEAQPLVVLEAMAQGVPVVVSEGSAAAESVARYGGKAVPAGDELAWASALGDLLMPEVNEGASQSVYDRYWSDPLTVKRHTERLLEVYEGVVGTPR